MTNHHDHPGAGRVIPLPDGTTVQTCAPGTCPPPRDVSVRCSIGVPGEGTCPGFLALPSWLGEAEAVAAAESAGWQHLGLDLWRCPARHTVNAPPTGRPIGVDVNIGGRRIYERPAAGGNVRRAPGDDPRVMLSPGRQLTNPDEAEALGLTADARRMRRNPHNVPDELLDVPGGWPPRGGAVERRPPWTQYDRSDALDETVRRMARRGWRMHGGSAATRATVSRPWLWLPTWAHLLLCVVTCLLWACAWAGLRNPRVRRTYRFVSVSATGEVSSTRVPHT